MIESTELQVLAKIKKARRGTLFFIENFQGRNNTDAVRNSLERLVSTNGVEELKG